MLKWAKGLGPVNLMEHIQCEKNVIWKSGTQCDGLNMVSETYMLKVGPPGCHGVK